MRIFIETRTRSKKLKTNLAYIDSSAQDAVVCQIAKPVLSEEHVAAADAIATSVLAGITVRDETAHEQAISISIDERRKQLNRFRRERALAAKDLLKQGITPLAIIPNKAWEHICSRSGLIRLSPDEDGNVHMSSKILMDFRARAALIVGAAEPIVGIGAFFIALILSIWLAVEQASGWGSRIGLVVIAVIVAGITSWVMHSLLIGDNKRTLSYRKKLVQLQLWRFGLQPWEARLQALFPNGRSTSSDTEDNSVAIRLILPRPPADIAAILLKARDLDLKVAAVSEAIMFAESPEHAFLRVHEGLAETDREELRRYEEMMRCPIIYIERGSAVAIIAQFGDFPIEQKVVDEVVSSEFLI